MARYYPLIATGALLFLCVAAAQAIADMSIEVAIALTIVGWVGLAVGWYLRSVNPPRVRVTRLRTF